MTEPMIYVDLGVGGMTCADCVVRVTEAIESVPGVKRAIVDLETRTAAVEATGDVTGAALGTAVRATGRYNAFARRRRSA
jgi:Cu+-exporting ATPase